jgi:hypothetical protein
MYRGISCFIIIIVLLSIPVVNRALIGAINIVMLLEDLFYFC